jgi:hypothetical protein
MADPGRPATRRACRERIARYALARFAATALLASGVVAVVAPPAGGEPGRAPAPYVTRAGTFYASFHARPVRRAGQAPGVIFGAVGRWAAGPVVSVAYDARPTGASKGYWAESVLLERLRAGSERAALSELGAELNFRSFVTFDGAEVSGVPTLSPFYSPDLDIAYLVVAPGAVYEVAADEAPDAATAFVASFSAPGFPGLQLAPFAQVAQVTGYERSSLRQASAGPVAVDLSRQRADDLAGVIDALPSGPAPRCHEDVLLYRVVFRASPGGRPSYEADGHGCGGAVVAAQGGRALSPRRDVRCALFDAVAAVLPASAYGTLHAGPACGPPRGPRDGTVEGRLLRDGGPAPGPPVGLPGSVLADGAAQGLAYPASTTVRGSFELAVPPGRYTLTGSSPKVVSDGKPLACSAEHPVTVWPGRATKDVAVVCNVR